MIWLPISNSSRRCWMRSCSPTSIRSRWSTLALLLVACGASTKVPQGQPDGAEPASDPSAKITVTSASDPNRNQSSTALGRDGAETHMTAVNDCELPQCVGDAPSGLVAAIRDRAALARNCYEEALKSIPTLVGRLVIQLRVTHEGRSCPVQIINNELAESKTLLPCVRTVMEQNFPRPSSGCVDLQLPLRFVPEFVEGDAGTK